MNTHSYSCREAREIFENESGLESLFKQASRAATSTAGKVIESGAKRVESVRPGTIEKAEKVVGSATEAAKVVAGKVASASSAAEGIAEKAGQAAGELGREVQQRLGKLKQGIEPQAPQSTTTVPETITPTAATTVGKPSLPKAVATDTAAMKNRIPSPEQKKPEIGTIHPEETKLQVLLQGGLSDEEGQRLLKNIDFKNYMNSLSEPEQKRVLKQVILASPATVKKDFAKASTYYQPETDTWTTLGDLFVKPRLKEAGLSDTEGKLLMVCYLELKAAGQV